MKNELIDDKDLPIIYQGIINMFENSENIDNSLDFSCYSSCDFYTCNDCLWLDDIFCIVCEKGKLSISFNTRTPAVLAATLIRFFMKNGYDLVIYESYFYCQDGELAFESDSDKMDVNFSLN